VPPAGAPPAVVGPIEFMISRLVAFPRAYSSPMRENVGHFPRPTTGVAGWARDLMCQVLIVEAALF